jgi:hypothetical protein
VLAAKTKSVTASASPPRRASHGRVATRSSAVRQAAMDDAGDILASVRAFGASGFEVSRL